MMITRFLAPALVAALLLTSASVPPAQAASLDQERILSNYTELFAGTEETNADARVARKIGLIESNAAARTAKLLPMDQWDEGQAIFSHLPLAGSETNITSTFGHLADIALETRTPGTAGYADTERQSEVITALRWMVDNQFSGAGGYYGNWYQWEIGAPTQATKALTFVREQAAIDDPELLPDLVAAMDEYLRAGAVVGDVDLSSRFHTGANLADITTNRVIQGALVDDDARVTKAVADQMTVFATIDPNNLVNGVTDGYYRDGSFIQHSSVAYTGSYGKVLLTRVMQTIKVLDGTKYLSSNSLTGTVLTWIRQGFAPIIYEGYVMEMVKGRGVSRQTSGYTDVVSIIEAMTDLTRALDGTDAAELRSYIKFVVTSSPTEIQGTNFVSPASILEFANVMANSEVPSTNPYEGDGQFTFNSMEKDVHLGNKFAFALARSSERISKYEYMSGENLQPWFQGDGAYSLYLSGQNQSDAHGADYYTVVDPMRLSGVTAPVTERRTIPELYDGKLFYDNEAAGFTASSVLQNEYVYFPLGTNEHSGGSQLDGYGLASLTLSPEAGWADKQAGKLPSDFTAYPNAEGSKSFFMLDDLVVVLGAGIHDDHDRGLTSTVDSRIAMSDDGADISWIGEDGSSGTGATAGALTSALWRNHGTGVSVGYAFLDGNRVTITSKEVTRDRTAVRTKNTGTVTRDVTWIGYEHAGASPESIAYAIVPNATDESLQAAVSTIEVIENSIVAQAVRHDEQRVLLSTFFTAGAVDLLTSDGAASVILRETDAGWRMAVSDPTFARDRVRLTVKSPNLELVTPVPGVSVVGGASSSVIEVDTRDGVGAIFEFDMVAGTPPPTAEPSPTPSPTPTATTSPTASPSSSPTPGPSPTRSTNPTSSPSSTRPSRPGLPNSGD